MARTSQSAKKKTSTRRKPKPPSHVFYVTTIDDWDWSLSFGVGDVRSGEGAYHDFRHLLLRGRLLRPEDPKVREVEIWLLPDCQLNQENWPGSQPRAVGSVEIYRGRFKALLRLPANALAPTLQGLASNRLCYVVLNTERPSRGRALVESYSLERTVDEEDL